MNLDNFEEYIDKKILERGHEYYVIGNIIDEENIGNNRYLFEVEGNENNYDVAISLDSERNIITSECNCPYEFGDVCKHEVASFYYLRENRESIKEKNEDIFSKILKCLKKEELINIINDLVIDDKESIKRIILKYSKTKGLKEYKDVVDRIMKKYVHIYGEVKINMEYKLIEALQDVINTLSEEENLNTIIKISNYILDEIDEIYSEEYELETYELIGSIENIWSEKIETAIEVDKKEKLKLQEKLGYNFS
ncbi:MAG: SWIM zinc finger family protein [Clostridium sp.]